MGRPMGFEPTHDGPTTRCVNHFTTIAIVLYYITKFITNCKEENEKNLANMCRMIYNETIKAMIRSRSSNIKEGKRVSDWKPSVDDSIEFTLEWDQSSPVSHGYRYKVCRKMKQDGTALKAFLQVAIFFILER